MPDLNGPETLEKIRKISEHVTTPVVFLTAKSDPEEQQELLALGAIGVIPKPIQPATFGQSLIDLWTKNQKEAA